MVILILHCVPCDIAFWVLLSGGVEEYRSVLCPLNETNRGQERFALQGGSARRIQQGPRKPSSDTQ
jgi:hypothetical protein